MADQLAGMRTALMAESAPVWLPNALHALILACLARLVARLEDLVRLWQAGLLPPLPTVTAPARRRTPSPARTRPAQRHTRARRNGRRCAETPARAPSIRIPTSRATPQCAASRPTHAPRPRKSHDPPRPNHAHPPRKTPLAGGVSARP
jgi:hypothetical protein